MALGWVGGGRSVWWIMTLAETESFHAEPGGRGRRRLDFIPRTVGGVVILLLAVLVFVAACEFSLVAVSRVYSLGVVVSLVAEHGL